VNIFELEVTSGPYLVESNTYLKEIEKSTEAQCILDCPEGSIFRPDLIYDCSWQR